MYYDRHSQTFGRLYSLAAFTVVQSVISLGYHGWRPTEPNGSISVGDFRGFTLQRLPKLLHVTVRGKAWNSLRILTVYSRLNRLSFQNVCNLLVEGRKVVRSGWERGLGGSWVRRDRDQVSDVGDCMLDCWVPRSRNHSEESRCRVRTPLYS